MRYLYYCNSTYQLLNTLNLHWHRKKQGFENIVDYHGDLIIQNSFEGASQIAEIIQKENVFDKVYLLNKTYNKGFFHSFKTLMDFLFPQLYLQKKHNLSKESIHNVYDVICAPKYSMLIDQIWRVNKKAYLDLCEDGMVSYNLNLLFHPNSNTYEKLRKILKVNRFEDYKHLYLVNLEMYNGKNRERIVQLPKFDEEYLTQIRNTFSSFSEPYEEKKIYWLSQFLNNEEFNQMVATVIESLVDYKEDVLFCQHPRTHMDNVHEFAETDGKQIWELQILNMKDIDKKLFISVHSTACFTAKMLYDEEPYIIMFYRMGDKKVTYVTERFEESVKKFSSSYSDPSKIMLPENIDEFKKCVADFIRKTEQN